MIDKVRLIQGDCLEVLPALEANSIDAIVTDPPYGLSFMGKAWDGPQGMLGQLATGEERRGAFAYGGSHSRGYKDNVPAVFYEWCLRWATEALRVAKPGAHLLAFGGTRTFHRLACAIEDAGWEIRDTVMWVYGSGFPKSHNLTGDWQGWGTALKPAFEPIILARKPLIGTVAANVLAWGTGALNVDGCRIPTGDSTSRAFEASTYEGPSGYRTVRSAATVTGGSPLGRWPANLIHDGSEEVLALMPETGPSKAAARGGTNPNPMDWGNARADGDIVKGHDDNGGSAARFFKCCPLDDEDADLPRFWYVPKASKADRDEGLDGMELRESASTSNGGRPGKVMTVGAASLRGTPQPPPKARNVHPCVKPTALMRYLCRLVTPPAGVVLDPFMGSGSTGKAAIQEGFRFVGIELEPEYLEIAKGRIAAVQPCLS